MDRVAAFLGVIGWAAAAGALAICDLVVLPGLRDSPLLADPNQAISIAGPLQLRCAEVTLVGVIVAALCVPRWLSSKFATTTALLAVGCAGLSRFAVLPRLYDAWGRVDLVAARPLNRLDEAQALAEQSLWLDGSFAVLLVTLAVFIALQRPGARRSIPATPKPEPSPEATPAAA